MTTNRRDFLVSTAALGAAFLAPRLAHAEDFKVGLLTSGAATEAGWNRVAYDALLRIEKDLGAQISNVELGSDPAAYEKAFRDYASRGFNVVIAHGFEFEDSALEVGPDHSETLFLVTSSSAYQDNVIGINLDVFQPFFLIGALAGMRADKVGFIGGVEIPPIKGAAIGFSGGARYVRPDVGFSEVMTGSWSDVATAKEAAHSMIASGVKFIVPDADVAGVGALQAVAEGGEELAAFGTFGDQTEKAPRNILGNYVPDLGEGLVSLVAKFKEGTFTPAGHVVYGLETPEVIKLTFNDQAAHPVTAEERAKLDEITRKIIAKEIDPTK
jgi:simple sugar transport system substrate-binding protein